MPRLNLATPPPRFKSYDYILTLQDMDLKVLSSHLNWGARLHSFDPL